MLPLPEVLPAILPLERSSCMGLRAVVAAETDAGQALRCKPPAVHEVSLFATAIESSEESLDLVCDLELATSAAKPHEETAADRRDP